MSWSRRNAAVTFGGALLAGAASVLALAALRALALPDAYASVLGLSVALPLLLYANRSSLGVDATAYADARGRNGTVADAVLVALAGAVGGSAAVSALLESGLSDSLIQGFGVGVAVLAGHLVFILRNRRFFEGNPWIGGGLGGLLD